MDGVYDWLIGTRRRGELTHFSPPFSSPESYIVLSAGSSIARSPVKSRQLDRLYTKLWCAFISLSCRDFTGAGGRTIQGAEPSTSQPSLSPSIPVSSYPLTGINFYVSGQWNVLVLIKKEPPNLEKSWKIPPDRRFKLWVIFLLLQGLLKLFLFNHTFKHVNIPFISLPYLVF